MDNFLKVLGAGVLGIFIACLAALITGIIVMLLWNWIMPVLFGFKAITYLQGWGISFLCGLLFRGTTTVNTKD